MVNEKNCVMKQEFFKWNEIKKSKRENKFYNYLIN